MTEINKKFLITVIAVVFFSLVAALYVFLINKINGLNNNIDNLNGKISQLTTQANNNYYAIDNLKREIKNQLIEEGKNYFNSGYEIVDIDNENQTATIDVYFSLKESPISTDVIISYGKGSNYSEITANKIAEGKYAAEITIPIDDDYEICYSMSLTSTVKTEKLIEVNVLNLLTNRFNSHCDYPIFDSSIKDSTKSILSFYISNNYGTDNNSKLKAAKIEIFKENERVKTINVMDYAVDSYKGTETFANKILSIDEIAFRDLSDTKIKVKMSVTDYYDIEYVLYDYEYTI